MIIISLEDIVEDIDEICRLARKFEDGEIVMCLGGDSEEPGEAANLNYMTEETIPMQADEESVVNAAAIAGQQGFSMVELLIAVTLISIVLLAVAALTSLSANGLAIAHRKSSAESYAVQLSSKLKAEQKILLPEGGAFSVEPETGNPQRSSDATVALKCSSLYCDRIVLLPAETEGTSATERVFGWDDAIPSDATVKFIRAWSLSDEDAQRNWRRITVAIFPPDSQIPVTYSVTGGVIK